MVRLTDHLEMTVVVDWLITKRTNKKTKVLVCDWKPQYAQAVYRRHRLEKWVGS